MEAEEYGAPSTNNLSGVSRFLSGDHGVDLALIFPLEVLSKSKNRLKLKITLINCLNVRSNRIERCLISLLYVLSFLLAGAILQKGWTDWTEPWQGVWLRWKASFSGDFVWSLINSALLGSSELNAIPNQNLRLLLYQKTDCYVKRQFTRLIDAPQKKTSYQSFTIMIGDIN